MVVRATIKSDDSCEIVLVLMDGTKITYETFADTVALLFPDINCYSNHSPVN